MTPSFTAPQSNALGFMGTVASGLNNLRFLWNSCLRSGLQSFHAQYRTCRLTRLLRSFLCHSECFFTLQRCSHRDLGPLAKCRLDFNRPA